MRGILCAVVIMLTQGVALAHSPHRLIVNPQTYTSPSGEYALHVDPTDVEGRGAGAYRLTRNGAEVWAAKLPFTFFDARVADSGVVGGVGYSAGYRNRRRPGDILVADIAVINVDGTVLTHERIARNGYLNFMLRGCLIDGEQRWFIARCTDPGPLLAEDWRIYALTSGKLEREWSLATTPIPMDLYPSSVQPVDGTPLFLVGAAKDDLLYALINLDGNVLWRSKHDDVFDKSGAGWAFMRRVSRLEPYAPILGPRQFRVWNPMAHEYVTYAVAPDGAGKEAWSVAETDRGPFPTEPRTAISQLERVSPRHLGTIELEIDNDPLPEVHEVDAFDFDDQGRLGVVRRDKGEYPFLLLSRAGKVLRRHELSLDKLHTLPRMDWIGGDDWVITATYLASQLPDGRRYRSHLIDAQTGEVGHFSLDETSAIIALKPLANGGLLALHASDQGAKHAFVAVYDESQNQVWKAEPLLLESARPNDVSLLEFPDGSVAVHAAGSTRLDKYEPSGDRYTKSVIELASREYDSTSSAAAPPDGVVHTFDCIIPTLSRFSDDGALASSVPVKTPAGRYIDALGWDGLRLRTGPDGGLWTSDGHGVMRIGADGVIDAVYGESPDCEQLRHSFNAHVDQQDRIYIADHRSGMTHVFDDTGKRLMRLPPNQARPFHWVDNIDVDHAGSVFVDHFEFAADGTPRGLRLWAENVEYHHILDVPERLSQPNAPRHWVITQEGVWLLDDDDQVVKKIARRASGDWLDVVAGADVAADGSLAVVSDRQHVAGPGGIAPHISVYDRHGVPIASAEWPTDSRRWYVPQVLFSGRNLGIGPYDLGWLLLDTRENPPEWRILEDMRPYKDRWSAHFARDGREIWLVGLDGGKVERFALPE